MYKLPPRSTLFPYTTLFRSLQLYFAVLRNRRNHVRQHVLGLHPMRHRFFEVKQGLPLKDRSLGIGVKIAGGKSDRSEEHTSELQSQSNLVCRLLLEKKKKKK